MQDVDELKAGAVNPKHVILSSGLKAEVLWLNHVTVKLYHVEELRFDLMNVVSVVLKLVESLHQFMT
jgi:hypothetical protein